MSTEKKSDLMHQPHILVVDDDVRICDLVSRYLMKNEFVPLCANTAEEARALLAQFEFDALVVDVMMPGETGLEFAKWLKETPEYDALPIVMLTALGTVDDRVAGFEVGVDDYLPKPFEPRELVMRLQAILRRTQKKAVLSERYRIGAFVFDAMTQELRHGDEIVKLTDMEMRLLKALAEHHGDILSRDDLSRLCDLDVGERAIDVQVTRLRRKIEEDSKVPRYLQTVRGKGYLLRAERLDE